MPRTCSAPLPRAAAACLLLPTALLVLAGAPRARGDEAALDPHTERPSVRASYTDTPPTIDGRLDEASWQQAGYIPRLHQEVPVAFGEASQRTELWFQYDENFLYIGARAHDTDADQIIARKMVRDADMASDDRISFNLDPLHDQRNGYYFQINSLGNKRDGLIENGVPKFEWDGIWYADGRTDADGYVIEVAIPFKTLSIDPAQTTWGLQVFRGIKRINEFDVWSLPTPDIQFFNLTKSGTLTGLEGIHQGLGLDVVPKLALRHIDNGQTGRESTKFEPGLDAFYKFTPSLTGSLTVNTDFGEAEVDTRQVNLDRFSLFFPEKRQFFLQDTGIFDFGGLQQNPLPFFSRRVGLSDQGEEVGILAGGKLTGRVGPFNIGILDVVTEGYQRNVDGDEPDPIHVDTKNLAVARVSMNVLEESTIGGIFTHGDPNSNDENLIYGADFYYRNSHIFPERSLIGRAWVQRSHNDGSTDRSMAFGGRIEYPNDRILWRLIAEEIQQNFTPALGFASRTGIRNYVAAIRHRLRPDWIRTLDTESTGTLTTDTDDRVESASFDFQPATVFNAAGDGAKLSYQYRYDRPVAAFTIFDAIVIPTDGHHWHRAELVLTASNARALSGSATVSAGGFRSGTSYVGATSVAWRPSRFFVLAADYEIRDVNLDEGDFTVHIARGRFDVQFSPMLSWNNFVQYDNASDEIGIQSRVRWIVRPGSEVFVVFNQTLIDEQGTIRRGLTEPRAKVGWTFRF